MPTNTTLTFEAVAQSIRDELRRAAQLSYVSNDSIIITAQNEREVIPAFKDYLIRISAPDSGFLLKTPRIGRYYRNTYTVAIELWIKSSSRLTKRLLSGHVKKNKGIFEFFQDVVDILEHNTFDGLFDSYPGSNFSEPVILQSEEKSIEGIGFLWSGNQDNFK